MKKLLFSKPFIPFSVLTILIVAGCVNSASHYMRDEIAQRVAHPAWMVGRYVPSAPLTLKAYERVHERGGIAHLYIEGDGETGESSYGLGLSDDPTPTNPVALHLASKDKAGNVIYLARPCQYVGIQNDEQKCPHRFWHEDRYGPEVMRSYNSALDEIRKRWNISGFHVIGYNGGATIAAHLAATRGDILSLRSVAGKLGDSGHGSGLNNMPQHHFIGGQDEVVRPEVLHQYLQDLGPSQCVHVTIIQEATHDEGWVDKWPGLLEKPVTCQGKVVDPGDIEMLPFEPDEGVFTSREKPAKP